MIEVIKLSKLIDYQECLEAQTQLQEQRIKGDVPDRFYLLEHNPVFTVGKRIQDNPPIINNIQVIKTNRGGNITYHGPGQLVIYPIIDVRSIGIKNYIYKLEELIITLCSFFNVKAGRDKKNKGVWVKNKKIASVGVAVKRGVSMHGIAVNINTDLTPFSWINPCGLPGVRTTSLKYELNHELDMNRIMDKAMLLIEEAFNNAN